MAITFPATPTTNSGNNPASGTWVLPTGWAANDIIVVWWTCWNAGQEGALTVDSDLTELYRGTYPSPSGNTSYGGYRRLVAGDTDLTWSGASASNNTKVWGAAIWRGCETSGDPWRSVAAAVATGTSTSPDPPSVTMVTDDVVVTTFGLDNNGAITVPGTYTTAGNVSSDGHRDASGGMAYKIMTTTGTEDPGVWATGSGNWGSWTGALKPAADRTVLASPTNFATHPIF